MLTNVERAEAQQLWVGEERELIVDKFDIPITRGKLKCLEPGSWLNDEVINFHMKMLQERSASGDAYAPSWFCSTFFFSKLTNEQADGRREYTYKNVMRWTKRAQVDVCVYSDSNLERIFLTFKKLLSNVSKHIF